jgi:shikimate kinase
MKINKSKHISPKIILIGPPCCGKGKVIDLCENKYGLVYVDVKYLIQKEAIMDSPLSIQCAEALEKGE